MIRTPPIQVQKRIFQLLVHMWREADSEGEQKHWTPVVHKAFVLRLCKRKGDMQSLDKYREICLLSMISRVLARLATLRCSKYFETQCLLVNEQGRGVRET